MKREKYLKPQTARELLAMEQGICAGSVFTPTKNEVKASTHSTGFDSKDGTDTFSVTEWN
ncbi:MAG: hypothetical protein IKY37_08890 [Bacteroidaceae bacterium]|nr:hypothetical protein [Bacteroidaceae bacterium]